MKENLHIRQGLLTSDDLEGVVEGPLGHPVEAGVGAGTVLVALPDPGHHGLLQPPVAVPPRPHPHGPAGLHGEGVAGAGGLVPAVPWAAAAR